MILQKTVYESKLGSRVTVHQTGDVCEIQAVKLENLRDQQHLTIFLIDCSGSMFKDGTRGNYGSSFHYLLAGLIPTMKRCLDMGHMVKLILWANDSAVFDIKADMLTEHDLMQLVDDEDIAQKIRERRNKATDFQTLEWCSNTLPRLGLERLDKVLTECKAEYVNLFWSTDGLFQYDDKRDVNLTATFMDSMKAKLLKLNIPIKITYLGIANDGVPDTKRIMELFPVATYDFVQRKEDFKTALQITEAKMFELITYDRICAMVDGKRVTVVVPLDGAIVKAVKLEVLSFGPEEVRATHVQELKDPTSIIKARTIALDWHGRDLATKFASKGVDVSLVKDLDAKAATLLSDLTKLESSFAKRDLREHVYRVMRHKRILMGMAAQKVHSDEEAKLVFSKMLNAQNALVQTFDDVISKFIVRNKRQQWTHTYELKEGNCIAKVTFPDRTVTYTDANIPAHVLNDTGIDLITTDEWNLIYTKCDTRCIGVLLEKVPESSKLYTPSVLKLQACNLYTSLNTLCEMIAQRVNVDGHVSLFDAPFVGSTAAERYNFALPMWGPWINFLSRMTLKPMIAYVLGGHELAVSPRWPDIYVPAIESLLIKFLGNKSSKILNDIYSLAVAFVHIRQWLQLGNLHEMGAISPADIMNKVINAGELGAHSFPNLTEVLIWILAAKPSDETRAAIEAEHLFRAMKYVDLAPVMKEVCTDIIRSNSLDEKLDFKSLPDDFKLSDASITKIQNTISKPIKKGFQLIDLVYWACNTNQWDAATKWEELKFPEYKNLETEIPARRALGLAAIAHQCPSNAQRRGLTKTPLAALETLIRVYLPQVVESDKRDKFYELRFKNEFLLYHGGFPVHLSSVNLKRIRRAFNLDEKAFINEFKTALAPHIDMDINFHAPISEAEYHIRLTTNLQRVYKERLNGRDIELSQTGLFRKRCGHLLCPRFMTWDANCESHYSSLAGGDLPAKNKYRYWIPNMHVKMGQLIYSGNMNRDKFVGIMTEYAAQYVHADFLGPMQKWFAWYYTS